MDVNEKDDVETDDIYFERLLKNTSIVGNAGRGIGSTMKTTVIETSFISFFTCALVLFTAFQFLFICTIY